jgi:5-methyltetrahydrofolate--homocysteine methyltransferase
VNKLKELLTKKKVAVADGAWGSELFNLGLKTRECPETWNQDFPGKVKKVAISYIEAGAEIILTNTFGGNVFKLKKYGLENKAFEINKRGVEISKEAGGNVLVFASMGPSGEFLEPAGDVTEKDMISCFRNQAAAFAAGKPDGIVIETMSDINEIKCALKGIREITGVPVAVSITYTKNPGGFFTITGITPAKAVKELEKEEISAIGSNCGSGIKDFIEITKILKQLTGIPLWMKPNAGIPHLEHGKTVYPDGPEEMAGSVNALIQAGVSVIGGCCGTTPAHIARIVMERNKRTRP